MDTDFNHESNDSNKEYEEILKKAKQKEEATKEAGKKAVEQLVDEHIEGLIEVTETIILKQDDGKELLSNNIAKASQVPEAVRNELVSLHVRIKTVVEEVAKRIEQDKYQSCADAIKRMRLSASQTKDALDLVDADKKMNISCQTLKIVTEVMSHVNQHIIKKIEEAQSSGDRAKEMRLVTMSSVVGYEMNDLVINFIENFQLQGKDDILKIEQEVNKRFERFNKQKDKLRADANKPEIPENYRNRVLAQADKLEESATLVQEEWAKYLGKVKQQEEGVHKMGALLPCLKLSKDQTELQLLVLDVVQILSILRDSTSFMEDSAQDLLDMEIVSVDAERVRRLMGL